MPFRICSFYHHLLFCRNNICFDRTDLWFRSNESQSKQPSIELTFGFDRTILVTLSLLYPWNGLNVVVQHNKYCCNHWIIAYLMLLSRTHRHIDVFKDTKDRQDTGFSKPKQSSNSEKWSNDRSTLVLNSTFSHLQFKRTQNTNGGKTERTWYLMWKTADRGTVMEGKPQAPVVRKADNAIHRIKRYPPNKALSSG